MLFNSYPFLFLFLPVTLIGFFGFAYRRWYRVALIWLVLTSLVFYAYWSPVYLALMLLSIAVNYSLGWAIERLRHGAARSLSPIATEPILVEANASAPAGQWRTQGLLWLGISFNLGLLGYYKYFNFFVESVNTVAQTQWVTPDIILPIGISFYTFTQIAYLVDAYRGETQAYHWLAYTLFVIFFPQLVAGPILHHKELLPQFYRLRTFVFSHRNLAVGLVWFTIGLAKKVVIADRLSPWVAVVFSHPTEVNFTEAWIGALSYTLQLYFDFSGYSDMAIGLGWMFNITLPNNFDSPYKATSISDFWRRWHITLSNFLRDYLYIPLGGNRRGKVRQYVNLLLTMLLGGLWHGAGWTYVLWGGCHGLFLCVNHGWRRLGVSLPRVLSWGLTFGALVLTWVLFRAASLSDAIALLQALVGGRGVTLPSAGKLAWLGQWGIELQAWGDMAYLPPSPQQSILLLMGLLLWVLVLPNSQQLVQRFIQPLRLQWWWALVWGGVAAYCLLSLNQVSEFLYFQF